MEYKLIRSKRKTLSAEIRNDGLTVRAPLRATKREIEDFLNKHRQWIDEKLSRRQKLMDDAAESGKFTREELQTLALKAREYIPARVKLYSDLLGETCGKITIRCQRSRWGSCSTKRNLSFNCLLMLTPPEVIDSVVVHEVCHLREMNHSKSFYENVLRLCPDYRRWDKWLKENGRALIARLPE